MQQYMVEVALPPYLTSEFMELIPRQRAFINKMFEAGIITGYSLAADRSKLWVTFLTKTKREVEKVMQQFPISKHISFEIHELAFHDSANVVIPAISLN